jgi:two-component system chemotaxis response regulator CheY
VISSKKIQRLTVVLGDTNSFSRQIVRSVLGGYGIRHISDCRDGFEVIEAVQHLVPSVVLIDHDLKGLTAPEVIRMLRRDPRTQMLPVVLMSGAPTRTLVTESVFAGAHEFVAKPFSSQMLFDRVSRAIFVQRHFLRTRAFFGPAPYDQAMRELIQREAAELSRIATLPRIEDVFKTKKSDDAFLAI